MVHIEPDEQIITSAQSKILDDLVDLFHRRGVVEIFKMRGKIHTAQLFYRCKIKLAVERLKSARAVKA